MVALHCSLHLPLASTLGCSAHHAALCNTTQMEVSGKARNDCCCSCHQCVGSDVSDSNQGQHGGLFVCEFHRQPLLTWFCNGARVCTCTPSPDAGPPCNLQHVCLTQTAAAAARRWFNDSDDSKVAAPLQWKHTPRAAQQYMPPQQVSESDPTLCSRQQDQEPRYRCSGACCHKCKAHDTGASCAQTQAGNTAASLLA